VPKLLLGQQFAHALRRLQGQASAPRANCAARCPMSTGGSVAIPSRSCATAAKTSAIARASPARAARTLNLQVKRRHQMRVTCARGPHHELCHGHILAAEGGGGGTCEAGRHGDDSLLFMPILSRPERADLV
jgi:hypothetical protein